MTHKKVANKLPRVLRKVFGFTFIESHKIAKAMTVIFYDPENYLTADEENLMDALYQLAVMHADATYAYAITGTISSEVVDSEWCEWDEEWIYHIRLTNRNTGTSTVVTY